VKGCSGCPGSALCGTAGVSLYGEYCDATDGCQKNSLAKRILAFLENAKLKEAQPVA